MYQMMKICNVNIIVDLADSNELFYAKVKSGTTAYDLVCPAEYMAEKMYLNGLLQPLYNTQEEYEKYFPEFFANGVSGNAGDYALDTVTGSRGKAFFFPLRSHASWAEGKRVVDRNTTR